MGSGMRFQTRNTAGGDPIVSAPERPHCLLVTFLSLTRFAERSSGSHRRLSLLIEAVRQSGASLRVCCALTPDEAIPSVADACQAIERELCAAWRIEVSVVASVSL